MTEVTGPETAPGRAARATDTLLTRLLRLPAARTGYSRRLERTPVRDGVVLLGEHYLPDTAHPLGTVLVRTPYGRGALQDLTIARVLVLRGYHVLVQSCRGTFGSGGVFEPMAHEADDAQDTVAWLREQHWFDGRLATTGPSYLGWTQWALMTDPPPELRAAVVVVGPHDFEQVTHGRGAFTLNDFLGWSDMMAHQEDGSPLRGLVRSATARKRLAPAYAGLPLASGAEPLLQGRAPWYPQWVTHDTSSDPYWEPRRATSALRRADIPILLIGGWQDLFLDQTLEQYAVLHGRGTDVALTVGPWAHVDVVGKGAGTVARETLAWLDEHLAGATGRTRRSPVRIHVTGARQWRELPEWPPPTTPTLRWLAPGGALRAEAPAAGAPVVGAPAATFRYDPADPTPTVGGRVLTGVSGVQDNRALEARPDVVAFTTEPLAADLEIIGMPVVELEHSVDNPHADLFVRLCDVDPKGRSRNFSDVFLRLDPALPAGEPHTVRLELDACAHRLAAGHRLQLLVMGGSHPRFARNSGSDEPAATTSRLVASTHTVHTGRLELPYYAS